MLVESRLAILRRSGSSSTALRRFIALFYATSRANAYEVSRIYSRVSRYAAGGIMNSSSIAKRYAVVAIATLAAGLAVNHAGAAEPTQVPTTVVRYADLDLSRPKDAQRL